MAISKIPSAGFQDNVKFRNLLINGGMDIAQRGTSQASAGAGYHTVDRWRIGTGGSQVFTMSQDTDVPSAQGFAKSLKLACTTANASPSAGDQFHVGTRFEGQNLQYLKYGTSSAETLTLSFWVKSNKTGTLTVRAYAHDPSTDRSLSQYYTINSADTWEKKTLTFNGDTDSGSVIDNDNALSIQLDWFMLFGSNYTSGTASNDWRSYVAANDGVNHTVNLADSTSNYINITGVQLEAGAASDFEFLPFDINLRRCERYYTVSQEVNEWGGFANEDRNGIFAGRIGAYGNQPVHVRFPVRMRTVPTVTVYSLTGTSGNVSNTGTTAGSHSSNDNVNTTRVSESGIGYLTGFAGTEAEGLAFQYEADAEL